MAWSDDSRRKHRGLWDWVSSTGPIPLARVIWWDTIPQILHTLHNHSRRDGQHHLLLSRRGRTTRRQEGKQIPRSLGQHLHGDCEPSKAHPTRLLRSAIRIYGLVPFLILRASIVLIVRNLGLNIIYRTTYVGQVMAREIGGEPDPDFATRKGELAMLFYSIGWYFYLRVLSETYPL